jgi:hypothetical protein
MVIFENVLGAYYLVQSGKTASGGCSAGQGSSEPVALRIYYYVKIRIDQGGENTLLCKQASVYYKRHLT